MDYDKYFDVPIVNSKEWFQLWPFEGEYWRNIEGYNGDYAVSSFGRVLSKGRTIKKADGRITKINTRILKCHYYNSYVKVKIKNKLIAVHRIVALTFIPNPGNKKEVDHINTIKDDNRVINLRWVSSLENSNNPISIIHFNESKNKNILPVSVLDVNGNAVMESNDVGEVLRYLKSK